MSNEVQRRMSLNVRQGTVPNNRSIAVQLDQVNAGGPSPGQINVTNRGTLVDLSTLTLPGECWLQNLDTLYYVEYGIYDPETLAFFPLGEILPEDAQPIRLSRNIQEQYYGTGTGTSAGGETNRLMIKAPLAPPSYTCKVIVDAFEA